MGETMINVFKNTKAHKSEEGFTLIELMIVIVVIGILAAIAIPIFANQQRAAIDAQTKSDVRNARTAFTTYLAKHGGKLATDAVLGEPNNAERDLFSTENGFSNPNDIEVTLSSGTRLRIYDRKPVDGIGFEENVYYIQAWNVNGDKHKSFTSRLIYNGRLDKMFCVVDSVPNTCN